MMKSQHSHQYYKENVAHFTRLFCMSAVGISEFSNILKSEVQSKNWGEIVDQASSDLSQPSFIAFLDFFHGALNQCYKTFRAEQDKMEPNQKGVTSKEYLDSLAHIYNDIAATTNPYFRTQLNKNAPYIKDFGHFNEFWMSDSDSYQTGVKMDDDEIDPITYRFHIDRIRQLKILGLIDRLREIIPNGDSAMAKALYPILETMNPESIRKALDEVETEEGSRHKKWSHIRSGLIAIGAIEDQLKK